MNLPQNAVSLPIKAYSVEPLAFRLDRSMASIDLVLRVCVKGIMSLTLKMPAFGPQHWL